MTPAQAGVFICCLTYRGVSSAAKLSVSKTELVGSNPTAPAKIDVPLHHREDHGH